MEDEKAGGEDGEIWELKMGGDEGQEGNIGGGWEMGDYIPLRVVLRCGPQWLSSPSLGTG